MRDCCIKTTVYRLLCHIVFATIIEYTNFLGQELAILLYLHARNDRKMIGTSFHMHLVLLMLVTLLGYMHVKSLD